MVERNGAHCVEVVQIVLEGIVVTVPRHHVERGVVLGVAKELAVELRDDFPLQSWIDDAVVFLVCSLGCQEVALVCETVGADRSEVRNHEMTFENLANPPAMVIPLDVGVHSELDTAWDNDYLLW